MLRLHLNDLCTMSDSRRLLHRPHLPARIHIQLPDNEQQLASALDARQVRGLH